MNFYNFVGIITVFIFIAVLICILFASILIIWTWRTNKIIYPKTILLLMSMFEWPIKGFLYKINVDQIMVDVANKVYEKNYRKIPYKKRAVFLPQCLRHPKCPAKLGVEGIECIRCGKCGIGEFLKHMDKTGIKIFIVPGSSFIKRMIKKYKPTGIFGVGCFIEVQEGMKMIGSIGLIPQSTVLNKDGCVDTDVNWEEVINKSVAKSF